MSTKPPTRILIVGTSGSGKTKLARILSEKLSLPHVEMDSLYWQKDWQQAPEEDFVRAVRNEINKDSWILDGNYSIVQQEILQRATHVIWLNYSLAKTFYRGLSRTVRRVFTREEIFSGNKESFFKSFLSKESVLLWILQTHARRRKQYRMLFDLPPGTLQCIEITTERDCENVPEHFKAGSDHRATASFSL